MFIFLKNRLPKLLAIAFCVSVFLTGEGEAARLLGTDCAPSENNKSYFALTGLDGVITEVQYCKELAESIGGVKAIGGKSGADMLFHYASVFFTQGLIYLSVIGVLVIVGSGIQISMGGAMSEAVTEGKERIIKTLLSLVLLLMSNVILQSLNSQYYTIENEAVNNPTACLLPMPPLPATCTGDTSAVCSANLPKTQEFQKVCDHFGIGVCTVTALQSHLIKNELSVGSSLKSTDPFGDEVELPDGLWGPTTSRSTTTCSTQKGCCPRASR